MPDDPAPIDLALEKRRRAYDALWPIMASDPILQDYQNLLDAEYFFPPTRRRLAGA